MALIAWLAGPAWAADLPPAITRQLLPGYEVISAARTTFDAGAKEYWIVALARLDEAASAPWTDGGPARPLLLFGRKSGGTFALKGRNDLAVMRAGQGGMGEDPFKQIGSGIAVKGRFFTVENGVAGGHQHWTSFVTFRFDSRLGRFVFDNELSKDWSSDLDNFPDASALLRTAPQHPRRAIPGRMVTFDAWKRAR